MPAAHFDMAILSSSPSRCATTPFDTLPDELLSAIFAKVVATSTSPACISLLRSTSRRFYHLMADPTVLRSVAPRALLPHPAAWASKTPSTSTPPSSSPSPSSPSPSMSTPAGRSASRFMLLCGLAGNVDALFLLGMIKFYCLGDMRSGGCLLVRAAEEGHVGALHALATINAHGSGGAAADANPAVAAEVLWHAAVRGSRAALQELGHSYLDGYGVGKNAALGVRLLLLATSSSTSSPSPPSPSPPLSSPSVSPQQHHHQDSPRVGYSSRMASPAGGPAGSSPPDSPRVLLEETLSSLSGSLHEMVCEYDYGAEGIAGGSTSGAHSGAMQAVPAVEGALGEIRDDGQLTQVATFTEQLGSTASGESAAVGDGSSGPVLTATAGWEDSGIVGQSGEDVGSDCGRKEGQGQGQVPAGAGECVSMPLRCVAEGGGRASRGRGSSRGSSSGSSSSGGSRGSRRSLLPRGSSLGGSQLPSSALPPTTVVPPALQSNTAGTAAVEHVHAATVPGPNCEAEACAGACAGACAEQVSSLLVSVITCQAGCHLTVSVTRNVSLAPVQEVATISLFSPQEQGTFQQEQLPHQVIVPFMREWVALFGLPDGQQLCANSACSRLETRPHEFRCCVVCERAPYCSRTCQVADWKTRHFRECIAFHTTSPSFM
ncbi:hypothetical protein CLOM_g9485 [Closterium sp. NIES-68]|nr:hypothetical protein CLOM_g9485 [Closterium sp. NIES-68]GJP84875.1 hypothetical protein CLOP_g14921 [Closterium sp. NIES-67]